MIKHLIVIKRHLQGIVRAIENLIATDKKGDQNHETKRR